MSRKKQIYYYNQVLLYIVFSIFLSGCKDDNNHFLKSIEEQDWKTAQTILDRNSDLINTRLNQGYTLLHVAVYNDDIEMATYLIKNGIDVNVGAKEENGTPLHLAASMGRCKMAFFLIENGADVNCRDDILSTPLHKACLGSQENIVRLLLEHGAEVDAKTEMGKTPLSYACNNLSETKADLEIIRLLLSKGANPNLKCDTKHSIIVDTLADRQFKKAKVMAEFGAEFIYETDEGIIHYKGKELEQYIEELKTQEK